MLQLLPILYLFLFAFIIYKSHFFRIQGIKPIESVMLFVVKVIAALALYLVYTKTYTDRAMADVFKFFDDSEALHQLFYSAPSHFFGNFFGWLDDFNYNGRYVDWMNNWVYPYGNRMYNDNRIMIRLHALTRFFSAGNYHVHSIFFAFFSFTGLHLIAKAFVPFIQQYFKWFYLTLFLFPSILFWGSGCLKETLLILELGFTTFFFFQFCKTFKVSFFIFTIIGILSIAYTKVYILAALLPGMLAYFIYLKTNKKRLVLTYLGVFLILFLMLFGMSFVRPSLDFAQLLTTKQNGFVNVALETQSGSLISDYKVEQSWKGMLTFIPTAFYRVFVLPFPWQGNAFEKIAGAENAFFLFILILSFIKGKLKNISNAYLFSLSFAIVLYGIIGLTVPVTGAMVRYKIPALIFFTTIIFMNFQQSEAKTSHN